LDLSSANPPGQTHPPTFSPFSPFPSAVLVFFFLSNPPSVSFPPFFLLFGRSLNFMGPISPFSMSRAIFSLSFSPLGLPVDLADFTLSRPFPLQALLGRRTPLLCDRPPPFYFRTFRPLTPPCLRKYYFSLSRRPLRTLRRLAFCYVPPPLGLSNVSIGFPLAYFFFGSACYGLNLLDPEVSLSN